jgi:hypothetical protein
MKGKHRNLAMWMAVGLSSLALAGPKVDFALWDCHGRKVCSQDYAGVPILLEFGACW